MVADQSCLVCHGSYDTAPGFVQRRFPRGHFSYGYKVGEVIGAVSVSVPMEGLYRQIGANLKRDILYDGIVLLLFIAISGWIIRRTILTPVKAVAARIAAVAHSGNFSERLEQRGEDEIGELVGSFNELMAELDRKTAQRVESEDRYRNFIEIAQSPIVTFMSDGKIVISNLKAEKMFGMTKQELLGQSIFDFLEQGEELQRAVEEYFTAGSSNLIGTTTRQKVRDVCGRLFEVELVISVSQSDQSPMFSAILRAVRE
jgi:PAS domain S-box-containing protein